MLEAFQEDAKFYVGKRAVYVYKAQKKIAKNGGEKTRVRTIWGRITRVHGNSGAVRAKVSGRYSTVLSDHHLIRDYPV
jgi:ribosomal protein L35AE/L33A